MHNIKMKPSSTNVDKSLSIKHGHGMQNKLTWNFAELNN